MIRAFIVKYKVSERLANYDINYLTAWYKHYVSREGSRPVLLAVLHNFEEFDPTVMQDVFYICRYVRSTSPSQVYLF